MKKLTIGSLVYDDFDGIFFSYQSIRLNNLDILDQLDLLVVDNNPDSAEGKATKDFCQKAGIRYEVEKEKSSTSLRNKIFEYAEGSHTLCMDPHVLFEPLTIKYLISFYEQNPKSKDLFQGPLLMDCINCHDPMTHMDPVWRDHMWGTWGIDPRGIKADLPPFEIPMQGLGVFSCKTKDWLGFNKKFIGFGGEEGYIHEKFRKRKRKCWCLPFFRWMHRFGRPRGVPYPLKLEHRVYNYLEGFTEIGLDTKKVVDHFEKQMNSSFARDALNDLESTRKSLLMQVQSNFSNSKFKMPDLQKKKPANKQGVVLELPK